MSRRYIWTTGEGVSMHLHEMEDSHVQNTIAYITRRCFEWEHVLARAESKGYDVGPLIINGKPAEEWIDIFMAELEQRKQRAERATYTRRPFARDNDDNGFFPRGR